MRKGAATFSSAARNLVFSLGGCNYTHYLAQHAATVALQLAGATLQQDANMSFCRGVPITAHLAGVVVSRPFTTAILLVAARGVSSLLGVTATVAVLGAEAGTTLI